MPEPKGMELLKFIVEYPFALLVVQDPIEVEGTKGLGTTTMLRFFYLLF